MANLVAHKQYPFAIKFAASSMMGYALYADPMKTLGEMQEMLEKRHSTYENAPLRAWRRGALLSVCVAAQFSESPIHSSAKRGASLTRATISLRVASICSGVRTVESGFASREPM